MSLQEEDDDMILISGARNKTEQVQDLSNYSNNMQIYFENSPEIQGYFDYEQFNKYILQQDPNLEEIQMLVQGCKLDNLKIRFTLWQHFVGVFSFSDDHDQKMEKLAQLRRSYQEFNQKLQINESKGQTKKVIRNPLFQEQQKQKQSSENAFWSNYFEINQVKNDVKKDVERTYQDYPLFHSLKIKNLLNNILFHWSLKNPTISYRQGMNEVAASIIVVYFSEVQAFQKQPKKERVEEYLNVQYAEEDIYSVFEKILNAGGHMEMFRPPDSTKKLQNTILSRIQRIQDVHLQVIDKPLFLHFKLIGVELQIFLLRWIRCLFTREFHLDDSFKIWDAILWEFHNTKQQELSLVDALVISMIIYVRQYALENDDTSICLKRFLKYPPIEDLSLLVRTAFCIKRVLNSQNPEQTIKEESALQQMLGQKSNQEPQFITEQQNTNKDSIFTEGQNVVYQMEGLVKLPQQKVQQIIGMLEKGVISIESGEQLSNLKEELSNLRRYLLCQMDKHI